MPSVSNALQQLRCSRAGLTSQLLAAARPRQHLPLAIRTLATSSEPAPVPATNASKDAEIKAAVEAVPIPFQGVSFARAVPATPSYFTRQPAFNDLFIRLNNLLIKYHNLPTADHSDAVPVPWMKLQDMRERMSEPIKASHFTKVMRIAKRLHTIEESLRPAEVSAILETFQRNIDGRLNQSKIAFIDKFGRAVGTGRRKASKARAFVVEGTGEILINGKPLNEAFGRIHDRESAVWALTATERLNKYNIWALVEGGGTTGQAEAITLAVAKGLLAHEPALKPALRRGKKFLHPISVVFIITNSPSAGCITRDPRAVERKKHGHLKARKSPTWVKR